MSNKIFAVIVVVWSIWAGWATAAIHELRQASEATWFDVVRHEDRLHKLDEKTQPANMMRAMIDELDGGK